MLIVGFGLMLAAFTAFVLWNVWRAWQARNEKRIGK